MEDAVRKFWKDRNNRLAVWGSVCIVALIFAIVLSSATYWAPIVFGLLCVFALFKAFTASDDEGSRVTTREEE